MLSNAKWNTAICSILVRLFLLCLQCNVLASCLCSESGVSIIAVFQTLLRSIDPAATQHWGLVVFLKSMVLIWQLPHLEHGRLMLGKTDLGSGEVLSGQLATIKCKCHYLVRKRSAVLCGEDALWMSGLLILVSMYRCICLHN